MGQDGERKSKAGPESRDGRCGARCRQEEEEEDERWRLTCDWQVRGPFPLLVRSGALQQRPLLAAVVVTRAGLPGKFHHVVLFAGAAEIRTE